MIRLFKKLTSHSFIRFGITGGNNTIIDFAIFFVLYQLLSWAIIPANALAFFVANIQSYFVNKHWSFKEHHESKASIKEYLSFVSASIFSLIVGTSIILIGEKWLPVMVLKLISAVVTPLINYVMYRFVIFTNKNLTY